VLADNYALSKDSLLIKNKKLDLVLKRHSKNFVYIEKLALKDQNGLIRNPGKNSDPHKLPVLWILDFKEPALKIYSNSARFIEWDVIQSANAYTALLKWDYQNKGLNLTIEANIEVPTHKATTYWNLKVTSNNSNLFTLQRVSFPLVGDIMPSGSKGNIRFVTTRVWGQEFFRAEDVRYIGKYPSANCQIQFTAYYNDKSRDGLYICTRDTSGYYKVFQNHQPNAHIQYVRFDPWYMPETLPTFAWVTPYPTELRPYKGTWYEPAKFYRNWVTTTSFVKPNRDKQHKWVFENDFWIRSGPLRKTTSNFKNIEEEIDLIKKVKNLVNVNTAIHLYNWHHYQFDYMYPKYFPPRDGFREFLGRMKTDSIYVVPYINGRIADERVIESEPEFGNSVCLSDVDKAQSFVKAVWNKTNFATMCPSTKTWQNTLFELSNKLIQEYQCDGVYYDQVCNSPAVRCANFTHGHIPDTHNIANNSSGNHWIKGYRKLFSKVATLQSNDKDIVFISEDAAEPWNDFFDIFLMFNSRSTDTKNSFRTIPLYPTVYSGYTLTMGLQGFSVETDKYLDAHMSFLAREFVWGSQLGWLFPKQLYENKTMLNYARDLAQTRQKVHHYFNFGEMKRTPEITAPIAKLNINEWYAQKNKRVYFKYSLDPIQTSYWELNDKSAAIFLTNYSSEDFSYQNLQLNLDLSDTQLKRGIYRLVDLSGNEKDMNIDSNQLMINFRLKPYEVKVIELSAK